MLGGMQATLLTFLATVGTYSALKAAKNPLELLASRQYGLLERSQVLDLTFSEGFIKNQLRQHRWRIRLPDVYVIAGAPWSHEQDLLAACLAAGRDACASHRSALWLWGLGPRTPPVVEITVPRPRALKLPGVITRRSLDIDRAVLSTVRGIPVTNPLRALVDAGAVLTRTEVDTVAREAVAKRLVTWPAIAAEVERLAERGRRGVGVMRSVLDGYNVSNRFTPSELEVRARRLFRQIGLPEPQCEVVYGKEGEWRLDFYWPAYRMVIEVDGWSVHASEDARRRDHRKQNRATIDGNWVLRYDWHSVVKESRATAKELLEAFNARRSWKR
jgi:hypothetical protein